MALRYAVISSEAALRAWQLQSIEELGKSGLASAAAALLQIAPSSELQSKRPIPGVIERLAVPALALTPRPDLIRSLPSEAHVNDSPLAVVDAVKQLGQLDLDFCLLFGSKELRDALSGVARHGTWYFAPSDVSRFSTDAPGFWEIYYGEDVTGGMLLRASQPDVAGVVLKSGFLATNRTSLAKNVAAVFSLLPSFAAQVCQDMNQGAASYFEASPLSEPPLHRGAPSSTQVLGLEAILSRNRAARYWRTNMFAIDWIVASLRQSPRNLIGASTRAAAVVLLPATEGAYAADPCVFSHENRDYVFYEHYDYVKNRGSVRVFVAGENDRQWSEDVICEPFHLSYPQVFEHDGSIYCMPESTEIRKVCLYKAVEFPHRWQLAHTLLEDFPAVDSTLLRHNGKWWLFCTSGDEGYNSHLYVWHAADIFGPWSAHARNPVKIDARSAGPAGPCFSVEGQWYRPAQDCSRTYGGRVRINRIDKLTEVEFEETAVGILEPPVGAFSKGLHTLSSSASLTCVDLKRYVFKPKNIVPAVRGMFGGMARRVGVSEETIGAWKRRLDP